MIDIHSTAIVDKRAQIAADVTIGPYSIIGPQVIIGEGTKIGSHCVIEGRTTIGAYNTVHSFNSLGCTPQDKKYAGEDTALLIGDHNTIHQYCTFSLGTAGDLGLTQIGDHNWIMAYVHIAHDVLLGNQTILANNATLAGHVHVGDYAIIGGLTGVHQFVNVGAHVMIGFASAISQDVLPFTTVDGNPPKVHGCNLEGLRRRGFTKSRMALIRTMYRHIFRENMTLANAIEKIQEITPQDQNEMQDMRLILDFLMHSKRGIIR